MYPCLQLAWSGFCRLYVGSMYVCPHSRILLFSLVLNFATFYLFTCSCPIYAVLFLACNLYHVICYNKYLTVLVPACILRPASSDISLVRMCRHHSCQSGSVSQLPCHFVASRQYRGAIGHSFSNFVFLFRILSVSCSVSCEIVKVVCEKEEKNNHSYAKSPAD